MDFTVSYFHIHFHFHFHIPAKKSVQKGEVGSDPRAGYFFQRTTKFRAPPLSASLSAGEQGGYKLYLSACYWYGSFLILSCGTVNNSKSSSPSSRAPIYTIRVPSAYAAASRLSEFGRRTNHARRELQGGQHERTPPHRPASTPQIRRCDNRPNKKHMAHPPATKRWGRH